LMIRSLNRGPLEAEQHQKFLRYLELVEQETSRCSQIISNLLTFSRKSPPVFGQVSLEELIRRSILLSQHKIELSDIRLKLSVPNGLPPVSGDFNQLQQCVINLIFNAIDAMPGGGTLEVSAGSDSAKPDVWIAVKDTGQGISPQDLPHIFDPFFTSKKEGYGVGLGLSTVYGIVEHHKGTITVDSKMEDGSVFTIRLPASGE